MIKNLRNAHRIPWSDIEKITESAPIPASVYRENALAHQVMKLQVVLREGAVISASLYDQRVFSDRYSQGQRRKSAIAALEQLRLERS